MTFSDYAAFLDGLPPKQREERRPKISSIKGDVELKKIAQVWKLLLLGHELSWSQKMHYPDRKTNSVADWKLMPAVGITPQDATIYAKWLSDSGRIPGARLCTDREWEKAARGADGRPFTTGARVPTESANVDETYGLANQGPDEVGTHPRSDSPYGIRDMQGNALEIVVSFRSGSFLGKGGSWFYDAPFSGRLSTSEVLNPNKSEAYIGLRLCASIAKGE